MKHALRHIFIFLLAFLISLSCRAAAESLSATYARGVLSVSVPYAAAHAGMGRLLVEVLDPDDQVLGHSEHSVEITKAEGVWLQEVSLSKPLPLEDLVWERVRYHFQYTGEQAPAFEGVQSISEVLRRPVLHVIGQSVYMAGAPAAVRVIVSDAHDHPIAGASSVTIQLLAEGQKPRTVFNGRFGPRGTVEAPLRFPAGLTGNFQLHYITNTPLGTVESTQPVRIEDKVSILLTTEKPIYQPGQTIHIRALALERGDHHAAPGKLTFEVEDPRGNKVFKKVTATDAFGIASAEFTLADEVNLGAYHLRALMGNVESPANTAELAFNVQRYVLPKFKVSVDFTAKDGKPKRDYRPGEHVTGTVHANYFFGKPVDHAEIALKLSGMDVGVFEAGTVTGKTDAEGAYHFDLKLPAYFAGRPLNNGAAPVLVETTVKDNAAHSETRGEPITVSKSALLVMAVPEGGTLVRGLENRVFLLTSYADGTPAPASLNVRLPGGGNQKLATDKGGVAVTRFIPAPGQSDSLQVDADDGHGNRVSTTLPLQSRNGLDNVLLRTDRAVYKAGDSIGLSIFSTQQRGAVYVDIVKDGQTMLTRDLDIVNGRADLAVRATPEMSGTLDVHVYRFGRDAQAIGDHRMVFVQPAQELRIETTASAPVYRPGAEARIHFRVTDAHGAGVRAALGLQIVDEAVFALAEKQPGFAKVFFYLEQELMKPRYEIHSLSMDDAVATPPGEDGPERQHAAGALFAATETLSKNQLDTRVGLDPSQEKAWAFQQRYSSAFIDHVRGLVDQLNPIAKGAPQRDLPKLFAALHDGPSNTPRDAWGTPIRMEPGWANGRTRYFRLISAGADQRFGTADDLDMLVQAHAGAVDGPPGRGEVLVRIEKDRGPVNDLAQITGTVVDSSGATIPRAYIRLQLAGERTSRSASANAQGVFTFSDLPPGRYRLDVSSPGFQSATRRITVEARDLATVTAKLNVGSTTQTVEVTDARVMLQTEDAALPINGRAVGGIGGPMGFAVPSPMVTHMAAAKMMSAPAMAQGTANATAEPTHVRSYFPEALYINPEIITDGNGNAEISVPMADSITTWRMAMLASTKSGALGTGTSSLKVFQDFFVDLDLPVTLTQGDRVSIPIAVYNYAGQRGDVSLTLQPEDWYALADDTAEKSVSVNTGEVGGSQFTIDAKRIGKFKLTLSARMKGTAERADIVVREIEVVPNGREQNIVFNGRLDAAGQAAAEHTAQHTVMLPPDSIADASKLFVRLYPGPLSQVIEGMDSLLRMPYGCFEQTSSATYPNVLALDYMKRTKKLTPEVHAKAEGFIATGYQRLLTFEVLGGGFSWFGQAPANKILTAYGLMEFNDMSKVHDVDPNLIARTRDWLVRQQQPDGSWKPDTQFINEGATNRYNSDLLRITAYIAWSLENTGYTGPALDKARQFLDSHLSGTHDAYTLAVLANFAVEYAKDRAFTQRAIQALLDARTEKGEQAWWSASETGVYSTGTSAAIETTGLAVQALLKWRQSPEVTRKALAYIASKKQASGDWGTTQATITSLRALLLASSEGGGDARGTVEIVLNGNVVQKLTLTSENNDLFHQFVLPAESAGSNVELRFTGNGGVAYQVVGRYFVPWEEKRLGEALAIEVSYDRTTLAQNDIATATARVRNNLNKTANMVMVDLGIPPGFDLLTEDLQDLQEKTAGQKAGRLEKFSLTATQAVLYFNAFAPQSTVELRFRLRAKYPIRAKTFQSRVYKYYDPAVNATARPVQIEVTRR